MTSASTNAVHFDVQHTDAEPHTLVGIAYLAAVEGPAPLAVLLHGIPGSEKNHDLAHALRSAGWHTLVLHFSGSWGSGGTYQIAEQITDTRAALNFAFGPAFPRAVDPARVALIGFSLGSRAALYAAHSDDRVTHVISVSGICDFSEVMFEESFFEAMPPFLAGATTVSLVADFRALGNGPQPTDIAAELGPKPLLVVHGTADAVVPAYNADALAAGGAHIQQVMIEDADHSYNVHRQQFIESVMRFINEV